MRRLNLWKMLFLLCGLLLGLTPAVSAQTNLVVLGVGRLQFDMSAPAGAPAYTLADVQGFTYKAYVPATATTGLTVTATCLAGSGAGVFACAFPLTALPLTSTTFQTVAISASQTAPDGVQESAKTTAPFALRRAVPVAPPQTGMSILPATP